MKLTSLEKTEIFHLKFLKTGGIWCVFFCKRAWIHIKLPWGNICQFIKHFSCISKDIQSLKLNYNKAWFLSTWHLLYIRLWKQVKREFQSHFSGEISGNCSCSEADPWPNYSSVHLSFTERVNSQFSSRVTFSLNPPITLQLTGRMSRWSRTPSWCVATALCAKWQVNQALFLPPGGELVSLSTTAPKKIRHEVWFWAIWPLTPRSCHCDALPFHQPIPCLDLTLLLTPDWHQG